MSQISHLLLALAALLYIQSSLCDLTINLEQERVPKTKSFKFRTLALGEGAAYLRNIYGLYYTGTIMMGTPPQKIKVLFDTGLGILWVTSSTICDEFKQFCRRRKLYTDVKSMTFVTEERYYNYQYAGGSRYLSGLIGSDVLGVAGIFIKDQQFVAMNSMDTQTMEAQYNGVFGLSLRPEGGQEYSFMDPPFVNMIRNNLIEKSIFTFYFSKFGSPLRAQLTIGWVDETRQKTPFVSAPLISDFGWVVNVNKINVGNRMIAGSVPASIESGTAAISGPVTIMNNIITAIGALKQDDGLYYVDCNRLTSLPTITFYVNNQPLPIGPLDYVITFDDSEIGISCWCGFTPTESNNVVLGATFIRTYYTKFDLDKREISFAQAA